MAFFLCAAASAQETPCADPCRNQCEELDKGINWCEYQYEHLPEPECQDDTWIKDSACAMQARAAYFQCVSETIFWACIEWVDIGQRWCDDMEEACYQYDICDGICILQAGGDYRTCNAACVKKRTADFAAACRRVRRDSAQLDIDGFAALAQCDAVYLAAIQDCCRPPEYLPANKIPFHGAIFVVAG